MNMLNYSTLKPPSQELCINNLNFIQKCLKNCRINDIMTLYNNFSLKEE